MPAIEADLFYNGFRGGADTTSFINTGAFMSNFIMKFAFESFQPYVERWCRQLILFPISSISAIVRKQSAIRNQTKPLRQSRVARLAQKMASILRGIWPVLFAVGSPDAIPRFAGWPRPQESDPFQHDARRLVGRL